MENKKKAGYLTYLLTVDGAALTRARTGKPLGQDDVAQHLGINKSQVCRWEMEKTQPSQPQVFALVDLLGTDNFVRLNGRAVLTTEEIEVVRRLREG
jgi:DNA-binding transcriptional regulator YiaG